jgi:protein-L-isoaspartate(D-aspartate) O-methyltransferase
MSSAAIRAFYAKLVCGRSGVTDQRIVQAFATVEKERFLGPGPWWIPMPDYVETPGDHLSFLYQNLAVAIAPERKINCGEPMLHAFNLAQLTIQAGARIVHIGAGVGYYTAILAQLAGPNGTIAAYEIESDLAERAARNLTSIPNVRVLNESATGAPLPRANVVYANACATHPPRAWLEALEEGGRLLFPLAGGFNTGGMLLITRAPNGFKARFICPAAFIACIGAQDSAMFERLGIAFARGDFMSIRSLHLDSPPDETAWVAGDGWWLSRAPLRRQ